MELAILITVAIASGSAVASIFRMTSHIEEKMDRRFDRIEVAIAVANENRKLIESRLSRLEDHENKEVESMRAMLDQIQGWIDVVRQPIALRSES